MYLLTETLVINIRYINHFYRWDYSWQKNILGVGNSFSNQNKELRDISQADCERLLGCGVPIHRFKLNGALKSKWLRAGMLERDGSNTEVN